MGKEITTFEVIPKSVTVVRAKRGVQFESHPMFQAIDRLSAGEKLIIANRAEVDHPKYGRLRLQAKKRAARAAELSGGKKKFAIYTGIRPGTAGERILLVERTA